MSKEELEELPDQELQELWDSLDGDYGWNGEDDLYHRVYEEMEKRNLL